MGVFEGRGSEKGRGEGRGEGEGRERGGRGGQVTGESLVRVPSRKFLLGGSLIINKYCTLYY